jgi:hypothetical protein
VTQRFISTNLVSALAVPKNSVAPERSQPTLQFILECLDPVLCRCGPVPTWPRWRYTRRTIASPPWPSSFTVEQRPNGCSGRPPWTRISLSRCGHSHGGSATGAAIPVVWLGRDPRAWESLNTVSEHRPDDPSSDALALVVPLALEAPGARTFVLTVQGKADRLPTGAAAWSPCAHRVER